MPKKLYEVVTFPKADTKNGVLFMFQEVPEGIPFTPRRVLVMKGMQAGDARGGHTHYKTRQFLMAINGQCSVDLDDGTRKETVVLDSPQKGLLLYPYVWHVMHNFSSDAMLMVIADRTYDEKDYIRSREDFDRIVKERQV